MDSETSAALAPTPQRICSRTGSVGAFLVLTLFMIAATPPPAATAKAAALDGTKFVEGGLLGRINDGDYVWSIDFPTKDAALLGYAMEFAREVIRSCPNYRMFPDQEMFAGGWIITGLSRTGSVGTNLATSVSRTAASVAAFPAAGADAKHLVADYGCDSPVTQAVMDNATRLIAGRRPAHEARRRANLVTEKVSRLGGKHLYESSLEGLQSSGMVQLQQDMKQMGAAGFEVLECHYDADPKDEYYEVQYYWTMGAASAIELTGLMPTLIQTAQNNLQTANGASKVRHPLLDYGSPRVECPSLADPEQLTKRIFAPRKPGVSAGKVSAPTITMDGITTIYSYGPAPEDFVPPIPKNLDPDFHEHPVEFEMKKQQVGSLTRVRIQRFSWQTLVVGESEFMTRPREQNLFREDVLAAFDAGGNVIECRYVAKERGFIDHYRYWYKLRPAVAETSRLKSRIPDHPMLEIRSPLDACPRTAEVAAKVP